jgi:hypothetical protein
MSLPAREDVRSLVRRYRIEGYELEDLCQEWYLALLSGDDPHKHMRRLQQKASRRVPKVVRFPEQEYDPTHLVLDDVKQRTREDLDALVLMIASEYECLTDAEDRLLKLLRVSRFRRELESRVYEGAYEDYH